MRYHSLLPEWAYLDKELDYYKSIAVDIDKDGFYTIE